MSFRVVRLVSFGQGLQVVLEACQALHESIYLLRCGACRSCSIHYAEEEDVLVVFKFIPCSFTSSRFIQHHLGTFTLVIQCCSTRNRSRLS